MNFIRVTINPQKKIFLCTTTVPSYHSNSQKEKIYIPSMISDRLLNSSNYDDDENKLTGGRNGYGAKLTNIYSKEIHSIPSKDRGFG